MKVGRILFLYFNLIALVSFWTGNSSANLDSTIRSENEVLLSDHAVTQSSTLEIGDAFSNRISPERPVIRVVHYFFKSQSESGNLSSLSAFCQIIEQNYRKTAFIINANLPAFLIIFPHHYFT